MSFKEMKAAFIARLKQLNSSTQGVSELMDLAPQLTRCESVNEASGKIEGRLTQINHVGGELVDDSWTTAGRLVDAIGDRELSECFDRAQKAATANPSRRNTVKGEIARTGMVVQINVVRGGFHSS